MPKLLLTLIHAQPPILAVTVGLIFIAASNRILCFCQHEFIYSSLLNFSEYGSLLVTVTPFPDMVNTGWKTFSSNKESVRHNVRITQGMFKGYWGVIVDESDGTVTVEVVGLVGSKKPVVGTHQVLNM